MVEFYATIHVILQVGGSMYITSYIDTLGNI